MDKKIGILIPTRERPEDFIIFAESWRNTTEGLSDVIVWIDEDDSSYEEIMKTYSEFIYEIGERNTSLTLLNKLAVKYQNKYDYLGFMEDDCNFNTFGWESIFIKKLVELGDNGIVWGNDLLNKDHIVGLPFMNSKIVRKLGFMSPPELKYIWCDYFWKRLGTELNSLHYFPDVIIEHRHYSTGKRNKDAISEIVDSVGGIEDTNTYNNNYMRNRFKKDVERLKND